MCIIVVQTARRLTMSRQFDQYMEGKFEVFGEIHELVEPENFEELLAFLDSLRPMLKAEIPEEARRSKAFSRLFRSCMAAERPMFRPTVRRGLPAMTPRARRGRRRERRPGQSARKNHETGLYAARCCGRKGNDLWNILTQRPIKSGSTSACRRAKRCCIAFARFGRAV